MNQEMNKEEVKNRAESYDLNQAIEDLTDVIHESADLYQRLKKVKFDYLVQTCELYSRIDFPSVMMEACRKEVCDIVPDEKTVDRMEF